MARPTLPSRSIALIVTLVRKSYTSSIIEQYLEAPQERNSSKGAAHMAKANAAQSEDREAFARRPETIGNLAAKAPQTGEEYLASLRDGRTV